MSAARLSTQQKKLNDNLSGSGVDTSKLADLQKQLADAYANSELAAINLDWPDAPLPPDRNATGKIRITVVLESSEHVN